MFTHHPKNLPSLIEIMYTISILSVTLLLLISNRSFLRILLKAPKVTWKAVKTAAHLPSHPHTVSTRPNVVTCKFPLLTYSAAINRGLADEVRYRCRANRVIANVYKPSYENIIKTEVLC